MKVFLKRIRCNEITLSPGLSLLQVKHDAQYRTHCLDRLVARGSGFRQPPSPPESHCGLLLYLVAMDEPAWSNPCRLAFFLRRCRAYGAAILQVGVPSSI